MAQVTDLDAGADDILGIIGSNAYNLLELLIPGLMPRYEFEGYSSQQAYDDDHVSDEDVLDESGEPIVFEPDGPDNVAASPTNDEILTAIERAAAVNRLDLVKHLRGLVGADFLGLIVKRAMLEFAQSSLPSGSPSSPTSTATEPSSETPSPSSEPTSTDSPERGESSEESLAPAGAS
jgi:hypothetical protein